MIFAQISLICAKILCGLKKKIEICIGFKSAINHTINIYETLSKLFQ